MKLEDDKTFRDYIVEYAKSSKDAQIQKICSCLGCSKDLLGQMMNTNVTKDNLNEYGRFDALKKTVDKVKAADYFSRLDGKRLPPFRVNNRADELLTKFILSGGYDIPDPGSISPAPLA